MRLPPRPLLTALSAALLLLPSCAVPPRAGDPALRPTGVRNDFFTAPSVRFHVFTTNDAAIPPEALRRSIATIERHLGRPIEIIDHGSRTIALDDRGELAHQPVRPFEDGAGRLIDPPTPPTSGGGSLVTFANPDRGITGCVGIDTMDADRAGVLVRPAVDDGVIVVSCLPGPPDGVGVTGYATPIPIGPDAKLRIGMVVLHASVIRAHSNWFVDYDKLYEWTLTHEIGHVLGVPAAADHTWVASARGLHCTHPECVMYTGLDWRVVFSGLLHGWPLDYCDLCTAELAAVREHAERATEDRGFERSSVP